MMRLRKIALGLTLGATGAFAQSGQVSSCQGDICYALSIPEKTASAGSGDIYFQLKAPTSHQWVALGQGTMMSNANMFIMYSSADGNNVTVSSRQAPGEVMPHYVTDVQYSVLDGSGISNGMMIANVRCSNCNSWKSGQTMDFSSGNSNWVFSHREGSALNTDDLSATLSQHSDYGYITFDVTQARTSQTGNPFVTQSGDSNTPSAGSGDSSGASSIGSSGASTLDTYITAHGSLATIAFVALYPAGALLIRFASFPGVLWVHGAIQGFAYLVFIAGAGLGIYSARQLSKLDEHHAIIGLVLLSVIFFMPFLGLAHHTGYKQTQKRGVFSYLHIYIGRAVILLGIINGGLGLQLNGAPRKDMIAYGVCAGVVGVVYIAGFLFGEFRRNQRQRVSSETSDEMKMTNSS